MIKILNKLKCLFTAKNKVKEIDERLIKLEKAHSIMIKRVLEVVNEIEKTTSNKEKNKDEYTAEILKVIHGRDEEPTFH